MEQKEWFTAVRAVGALACIVTLNALILITFLDARSAAPRWSIYVLIILIGGLLGIDALLDVAPIKIETEK